MTLRDVTDADGITWTVWEVRPDPSGRRSQLVTPELAKGWLCFQRVTGERRRLASPPPDWRTWRDATLLAALERARSTRCIGSDAGAPDAGQSTTDSAGDDKESGFPRDEPQ